MLEVFDAEGINDAAADDDEDDEGRVYTLVSRVPLNEGGPDTDLSIQCRER